MIRALTCPRARNSARPERSRGRRKPRSSVPDVNSRSALCLANALLGLLTATPGGRGSALDAEARQDPAVEREPADQDPDDDQHGFHRAQASASGATAWSTAPRKSRSGMAPSK